MWMVTCYPSPFSPYFPTQIVITPYTDKTGRLPRLAFNFQGTIVDAFPKLGWKALSQELINFPHSLERFSNLASVTRYSYCFIS